MTSVAHTEKVELPTEFTLGKDTDDERTYDLLLLEEGGSLGAQETIKLIKKLGANLDKEHQQYLLDHQEEIPSELRGKVYFIFNDECPPGIPDGVGYINWDDRRWFYDGRCFGDLLGVSVRVLRPRK